MIDSGDLVSIVGPNGSGKTIIIKMLNGKIRNDSIFIDNKNIVDYDLNYKRNNIACVFDDNIYNSDMPRKELSYNLYRLGLSGDEINSRLNDFINYFKLDKIIDKDFNDLDIDSRIFIKILSLLIIKPELFCIDDLLTYLTNDKRIMILNYIKENNITFLNVTSNMEELVYFDKILILNKGKKVIFDKTEKVLDNEELFKELGLSLPFIYDLNNMLKSYDLISENHTNFKELVDLLWK